MITQEQIEAAAKAIWLNNHPMLDGRWEDYIKDGEAALTAAAEVGEQKPTFEQIARTAEVITRAKLETIERCAQVAEKCARSTNEQIFETATRIAAAIRAMKEDH